MEQKEDQQEMLAMFSVYQTHKKSFRLAINFENFSDVKFLLKHLQGSIFTSKALKYLLDQPIGRFRETIETCEAEGFYLPFYAWQLLFLITMFRNHECGISNRYEKVQLALEHLRKAKKNGVKIQEVKFLPRIDSFSHELRNVKLAFEVIEFFEPSHDVYRTVGVLKPSANRDDEITDMINAFFDKKRDRKDIVHQLNHRGDILEVDDDSDSESEPQDKNGKKPYNPRQQDNRGNYNNRGRGNYQGRGQYQGHRGRNVSPGPQNTERNGDYRDYALFKEKHKSNDDNQKPERSRSPPPVKGESQKPERSSSPPIWPTRKSQKVKYSPSSPPSTARKIMPRQAKVVPEIDE